MALFPFNFTQDNRTQSINKAKFLKHTFNFPYEGSYESLNRQSLCVVGEPPGYEFVTADEVDGGIGFYQFNLLVPDSYNAVVLYLGENTPDLDPGDLLILSNKFYLVSVSIPSGNPILFSALTLVDDVIKANKDNINIVIPDVGLYNIPNNSFCTFPATPGRLFAAELELDFIDRIVYNSLPLGFYNIGDLEDPNIIIVSNIVEMQQIAGLLPPDTQIYVKNNGEYYTVTDSFGAVDLDTSMNRLVSPTRWLLSGVDAGLDFVNTESESVYNNFLSPSTGFVENLPYIAQIYGLNGLADGFVPDGTFKGTVDDLNPLTEDDIRLILLNSLGWCRQDNIQFNGIVPLTDSLRADKVDFEFDGGNNLEIKEGDKGIYVNYGLTEYTAISPTDISQITLAEVDNLTSTITVNPGDRVSGVLYDRIAFPSIKGLAMEPFVNDIPADDGSYKEIPSLDFTVAGIYQNIDYDVWVDTGRDVELIPGYRYELTRIGQDLPTDLVSEAGVIENVVYDTTTRVTFNVSATLDPYVNPDRRWESAGLNFRIFPSLVIKEPIVYDPANWLGYVGSRGSIFGMTVSNTILGLTNPRPVITENKVAVTLCEDKTELDRAMKMEEYIGARGYTTWVQYSELRSDLSLNGDFWFDLDLRSEELSDTVQQVYYPPTDQILTIDNTTGELLIDGQTTHRFFPLGSKWVRSGEKNYIYDGANDELYRIEGISPLSPFILFDEDVTDICLCSGHYLKEENVNPDINTLVLKDKKSVKKLNRTPADYYLFDEYPYLKEEIPLGGYYKYTDLNTKLCYYSTGDFTHTTKSGCVLYNEDGDIFPVHRKSTNQIYSYLVISDSLLVQNLIIVEDYERLEKYNFLNGEFSFLKLRFDLATVETIKYIHCERVLFQEIDSTDVLTGTPPVSTPEEIELLDLDPLLTEDGLIKFYY